MSDLVQPSIILLKEGTDTSQGKAQIISNINACAAIVDTIKTTLGPRGMDKLIHNGNTVTISNDGATIMKLLNIVHPAARALVDISLSQDAEIGDGTTSVVILAGEFLKAAKPFIEEGVQAQIVIKGFREAASLAKKQISEFAIQIEEKEKRVFLERCAATSLNSKLIASHKHFFSKMVVDAVSVLDESLDIDMIGIARETGGAMEDTILVEGVAFKKTFSYAGFEMQPKKFENAKVIALNIELELKAEKDNAQIKISDPEQYQRIVEAEWKIIYDKLDKIIASGAQIVLSRLAIGDLATQYFADRDIFCAGRVPEPDLKRVCKATGCSIQTTVSDLIPDVLGVCGLFEEKQTGSSRYNFFTKCDGAKSATIILRGGGEQFISEAERSLHDAIMITRRAMKHGAVVAGGGAVEMEVSKYLRNHSNSIAGKQQLIISAFAKALESIPQQLCDNAGFDGTLILNQLRKKHTEQDGKWFGVDIENEAICDNYKNLVWEPAVVKLNSLVAATEAANLILSIDETVRNESDKMKEEMQQRGAMRGRGRGRGRGR